MKNIKEKGFALILSLVLLIAMSLMGGSLIDQSFKNAKKENRPALLTYTVAGDNTKKKSFEILKSISEYADTVSYTHLTLPTKRIV